MLRYKIVKGLSAPEIQIFGFGIFGVLGLVIFFRGDVYINWWIRLYLLGVIGGGLVASSVFTNKKIEEWEKKPGSGGMKYWLNNNHLSWLGGINIHWFIVLVFGVFLIVWLGVVVAMWVMWWMRERFLAWRKKAKLLEKEGQTAGEAR